MQKRFPAAGESHIRNALKISICSAREKCGPGLIGLPSAEALPVTSLQIPSGAENLVLEQGREVFVLFEEAVEFFERFCAVALVEEGVNPVLREEDVAGALDVWQSGERFGDVAGSLLLS